MKSYKTTNSARYKFATRTIRAAGQLAMSYFDNLSQLKIEKKGHQDLVSEADKTVEIFLREQIIHQFSDDSIIGEEGGHAFGKSSGKFDYTWVIDPIDGTANFVSGIPTWAVVITLLQNQHVIAGFIFDPVQNELYTAAIGQGAFCNGRQLHVANAKSLNDGSVAVGFSNRSRNGFISKLVSQIVDEGGVFYRNASGALSLAYVAAGKLLGYSEDHMNAWDYLAGQLMVKEAGGLVEKQDINKVLYNGGRVIAATPAVFERIKHFTERAMSD